MNDRPPNMSHDRAGYNSGLFPNERAVRRAFKMLGYAVNMCKTKVSKRNVVQFQKDYNKCARKFKKWGEVEESGQLNKETLNALEIAVRWTRKRAKKDGGAESLTWQNLCKKIGDQGRGYRVAEAEKVKANEGGTNYVEVLPNGQGKLRNVYNDDALRAHILDFEKHGAVIFAVVILPPQADLPGGKSDPITCPCVFGCC